MIDVERPEPNMQILRLRGGRINTAHTHNVVIDRSNGVSRSARHCMFPHVRDVLRLNIVSPMGLLEYWFVKQAYNLWLAALACCLSAKCICGRSAMSVLQSRLCHPHMRRDCHPALIAMLSSAVGANFFAFAPSKLPIITIP